MSMETADGEAPTLGRPPSGVMSPGATLESPYPVTRLPSFKRASFRTQPKAAVISDAEGNIVDVTEAAAGALGYTLPELLGKNATMLMPPHIANVHRMLMRRVICGGAPRIVGHSHNVTAVCKDGSKLTLFATLERAEDDGETYFIANLVPATDGPMPPVKEDEVMFEEDAEPAKRKKTSHYAIAVVMTLVAALICGGVGILASISNAHVNLSAVADATGRVRCLVREATFACQEMAVMDGLGGIAVDAAIDTCAQRSAALASCVDGILLDDTVLHEHLDEPLREAAAYARSMQRAASEFEERYPRGVGASATALAAVPALAFLAETERVTSLLEEGDAGVKWCVGAYVARTKQTVAVVGVALVAVFVVVIAAVVRPLWKELARSSRRSEHLLLLIPPAIARRSAVLKYYDAADKRPQW